MHFVSILTIKQKGKYMAISQTVERALALFAGLFVLFFYRDLFLFLIILTATIFIKFLIDGFFALKFFKLSTSNLDKSFIKSLVVQGFPFIFMKSDSSITR